MLAHSGSMHSLETKFLRTCVSFSTLARATVVRILYSCSCLCLEIYVVTVVRLFTSH